MNKVKLEKNSDGTYHVTLPGGGATVPLSPQQAVQRLKEEEEKFQKAIEDMRARREELEKAIANA